MMEKTSSLFREYVHELEDGSLSDVWSDWKIEFMIHGDTRVDELKNKVEEMGIEIIGDVEYRVTEWGIPDFVTISTDTDIDDELYAELYEFSQRNHLSVILYTQSTLTHIENGVEVYYYYERYKLDCLEMDVILKMIKEDDPEEWARIQAENVS